MINVSSYVFENDLLRGGGIEPNVVGAWGNIKPSVSLVAVAYPTICLPTT